MFNQDRRRHPSEASEKCSSSGLAPSGLQRARNATPTKESGRESSRVKRTSLQAKRYAPDHTLDRKTIQAFIGSLAGQGVSKGVFITTSSFADTAKEFVLRGSSTKIVLIDGTRLLDLMMRHHIGVRAERRIEVLDIDQNYFSEEEE